ncbi:MAG: arylsulfotransferase family protein [Alphaproteobacteria bacterium]
MKKESVVLLSIAIGFLGMVYGVIAHASQLFPYNFLNNLHNVAESVSSALKIDSYNDKIRWAKPLPEKTGMVLHNDESLQDSYIVYSTTHDTNIRMIGAQGEIVHEWPISFNAIWPDQEQVAALKHLDDFYFYARDFHVYSNGDILVMLSAGGVTPWGMGMVRLDKDANVLWKYEGYLNNDFEVAADGDIYVIEHDIRYEPPKTVTYDITPFLEDKITILDAQTGKPKESFSLVDSIENSEFANLLRGFEDNTDGDPMHSNNIEYVERGHPDIDWIKEGYLLVSIRNLNALVAVDPKSKEIVHAYGLFARMQHDIDFLNNGNFLIYDNRGNFTSGGYSRVYEFKPDTQEIVWQYTGKTGSGEFDSDFWGMQDRLENGNTLIVDPTGGRIFEVSPSGEKEWEYILPLHRIVEGEKKIAIVTTAEKIDASKLSFLNSME